MALSPDFSISISTDRETITVTDETTYGGANAARGTLNVSISLYKVDSENNATEITVVGNDQDPATDTSWSGDYDVDGHYRVDYVATLIADDSEVSTFTYRRVLTTHGQWKLANMVSEQSASVDYSDLSTLTDLIELDNLLTAAQIADTRTEVTDGEIICRKIQSKYIDASN
jgi:hypothetical protein